MSAFQLALKNISGNAFRNFVVALCATLVSAFVLFTTVIMRGAESSLRLTIDRLGADVIVVPLGSQDTVESALLMGVPARVWMPKKDNLEKIAAIPGVEIVTPQMFLVTLSNVACCAVSNMFMIAYDPATDFTIEPWLKQELGDDLHLGEVVGGTFVTPSEGVDKIRVYGYLTTLKTNLEPTGTGLDQSVFLTFDTAYDIAEKSVTAAAKPLDIPPDSISAALIKVTPGTDPHDVAVRIAQKIPGVTSIESSDMFQTYRKQMVGLLRTVMVILSVTLGLSIVLIALVFSMAANERRKELGVLRALGATRWYVFQSLLAEASLLALFGGITGVNLASLAIFLFRNLIMVSLDIPFLLPSPVSLLTQIGMGLLLALFSVNLAALIPAWKISRQDPAVAMRE
jgi:putative ABC transport system permease protein